MLTITFLTSAIVPIFAETIENNINDTDNEFDDFIDNDIFDVNKMSDIEKEKYFELIEEQVNLAAEKYENNLNKEWFRSELRFVLETENSFELLSQRDYSDEDIFRAGTWVPDVKIKNSVAIAAINVVINAVLLSVGVNSVQALLREVSTSQARKLFTRNLKTKLSAWGLQKLATFLPFAVDFIFNLLNPAEAIVNYLDSIDDFPNNGYLDIIL